jgi:hypothetical protein
MLIKEALKDMQGSDIQYLACHFVYCSPKYSHGNIARIAEPYVPAEGLSRTKKPLDVYDILDKICRPLRSKSIFLKGDLRVYALFCVVGWPIQLL